MANDMPAEKMPHHRQQQPFFFRLKSSALMPIPSALQLTRTGDDTHADHRDKHAQQRHLPAFWC